MNTNTTKKLSAALGLVLSLAALSANAADTARVERIVDLPAVTVQPDAALRAELGLVRTVDLPAEWKRAYRELESEGYIRSVAGKGSFVAQVDRLAEQQKKEALNAFRAAAQRLRALGLSAEALASLLTQEEPTDD